MKFVSTIVKVFFFYSKCKLCALILLKIILYHNSRIKPIGNIHSIQCLPIKYILVELRYDYCLKWNYTRYRLSLRILHLIIQIYLIIYNLKFISI